MATSEHEIQKQIQVALSKHRCTVQRINVGKGFMIRYSQIVKQLPNGDYVIHGPLNYFDAGASKGHPDLYGFRWVDGKIFYIEVKSKVGKPSEDQIRFHNMLTSHNIIHGIARSANDALMIVDGGLCGFGYD
ncbi:VRR-NUC domain-containing protein [Lactobacillus crispatus]|uniref:VRR-NUC domain-containing protein n=1 Tax=Lactobacillus crispatus TaxID=47770 RepID=UPI0018AA4F9E|nr:VRR-NUC domain-containing protein [Lactobacillus crispatus]